MMSKLQLGDDEMPIETYIQLEGGEGIELNLSIDESVDVALGTNFAQDLDLNVHIDSVDMDDVTPPTIKRSDVE